jgi:hypothetical protein
MLFVASVPVIGERLSSWWLAVLISSRIKFCRADACLLIEALQPRRWRSRRWQPYLLHMTMELATLFWVVG